MVDAAPGHQEQTNRWQHGGPEIKHLIIFGACRARRSVINHGHRNSGLAGLDARFLAPHWMCWGGSLVYPGKNRCTVSHPLRN
ncbi:hypothetical protein ElyMa_001309300 [Elysia marginata]|uniref:Uncharacterized protein n=1 Tax=Elysia marginata TaxID=1093978 RepID=A0AAV4IIM1_9GAST|nr:hypothetical protein ElyMa_001309300 [Elysia marginata]